MFNIIDNLINGIHFNPFLDLFLVIADFFVEGFVNLVQSNAPVRFDNKLLLEPQLLLEIFNLRKKINDNLADLLDCLHLGKVCFDTNFIRRIQIIEMHHLVLDKEIKFARKESSQILMNKIVKGVLGDIPLQMFLH